MASPFFNILVHHTLVPVLRGEQKSVRGLLQKTLERLQLGSWGGGTRVKLLKGISKFVYEARVDRSLRLLFTVSRAYSPHPPHALEHYLLAWDIVDHDHIDRARRMNLQPETGFLDFDVIADMEIDEPPVAPEAAADYETSDTAQLSAWINDPGHINTTTDELTESIRWFEVDPDIITDEEEWQALLDDPGVSDLELKLSREQALTLYRPGPLLLRGTAGSGKTTVSVYRLARAVCEQPGSRLLLVTYSEPLLNAARQLFRDLFHARRKPLPGSLPDFKTFPQLFEELAGRHVERRQLLRYPHFEQWYRMIYRRNDAALAWEEIRGIIKGSCLDLTREHLSREEYEQLGRKRAPLFSHERPRLYQVFLKYQEWCRDGGRMDDIDLARRALRTLRDHPELRYHQVICDEGQDLTELEMRFLLELVHDLSGLFFAADPQQIVNPSGFRWAELRSLLRDLTPGSAAPEISSLTRNYRSVQSIVGIANAFVRVQRDRTGRSDDDYLQETTLRGSTPILVTGAEAQVIEQVKGFGPRCAIIVPTVEDAERLSRHLESERVFDIAGAKGLEFDGCVIWNLFGGDIKLWAKILQDDAELKEDPGARRVLRHAYVAITRARRYLGVYEADPAAVELWQGPQFRAFIEQDAPDALAKFMLFATSPDQWAAEGNYFLERGRFRQAAECYRRAGSRRQEQLAMAAFEESVGRDRRAADLFIALEELGRAAPCLARIGNYRDAAEAYNSVREWQAAATNYEAAGMIRQAAEAWQKANDTDGYRRCMRQLHERNRNFVDAARIAVKQNDLKGAIDLYMRAGMRDQVLVLRIQMARQEGDLAKVASLLEESGQHGEAAQVWRQAGSHQKAARAAALAAERSGDHAGAAEHWRSVGDSDRALAHEAKSFESQQKWLDAARLYERLGQTRQLMHCLRRSSHADAALWLHALETRNSDPVASATSFLEIGRDALAEEICLRLLSSSSRAVYLAQEEQINRLLIRIRFRRRIAQHGMSGIDTYMNRNYKDRPIFAEELERAGEITRAGALYQRIQLFADAARCFEASGDKARVHRCRAALAESEERFTDAAQHYLAAGNRRDYCKSMGADAEARGEYAEAITWYEQCRMTAKARRCKELLASQPTPPDIPFTLEP